MDITFISNYFVPVIIAVCLGVGYIMKNFLPSDNKYIPLALAIIGVACGIAKFGITLDAIACGLISGLASVGCNQAFKQLVQNGGYEADETTEDEVQSYLLEQEELEADEETDEEEVVDEEESEEE